MILSLESLLITLASMTRAFEAEVWVRRGEDQQHFPIMKRLVYEGRFDSRIAL